MSLDHIKETAENTGACERFRKFNVGAYIANCRREMCSPVKESEFTLNQMHSSYNELFD